MCPSECSDIMRQRPPWRNHPWTGLCGRVSVPVFISRFGVAAPYISLWDKAEQPSQRRRHRPSQMAKKALLVKRSQLNVLSAVHNNQKLFNKTWNVSHRAPIFTKKNKKVQTRKCVRTNRCASSHAWKILSSGAAAHVAEVADAEAGALRLFPELEASAAPGLFQLSKGFTNFLEQFLVAYATAVMSRATALKDSVKKQKKLSFKCLSLAARSVDDQLWASHGFSPAIFRPPAPLVKQPKASKASKESAKRADAKRFVADEAVED